MSDAFALIAELVEALEPVVHAERACPFFRPPYPAGDKPCPLCRMSSAGEGGTCVIDRANRQAVTNIRDMLND